MTEQPGQNLHLTEQLMNVVPRDVLPRCGRHDGLSEIVHSEDHILVELNTKDIFNPRSSAGCQELRSIVVVRDRPRHDTNLEVRKKDLGCLEDEANRLTLLHQDSSRVDVVNDGLLEVEEDDVASHDITIWGWGRRIGTSGV